MTSIDAKTLKKWLDNNEAVVVDVREPDEFEAVHIAGATLVPLATICKGVLPPDGGKKMVLHCRAGVRSRAACERLLAEDPELVLYNLEGGIMAWAEEGYLQ